MSDFDSEESIKPGCSDTESRHPGTSSADNQRQLGINVFSNSAGQGQNIAVPIWGESGLNPFTRSAHKQGNRREGGSRSKRQNLVMGGIHRDPNSHVPTPTKKYPTYSFVSLWLGHG